MTPPPETLLSAAFRVFNVLWPVLGLVVLVVLGFVVIVMLDALWNACMGEPGEGEHWRWEDETRDFPPAGAEGNEAGVSVSSPGHVVERPSGNLIEAGQPPASARRGTL